MTLESKTLKSLKLKFNMIKYHYVNLIAENLDKNKIKVDEGVLSLKQAEILMLKSKKLE